MNKKRSWTWSVRWRQQCRYWLLGTRAITRPPSKSAQLLSGPRDLWANAPIMLSPSYEARPLLENGGPDRCVCWGQMSQSWRETEWRGISSWVPGMPRELQGTRSRGNTSHRNQSGHQRVLLGPQLQRRCRHPWLQRLGKWWGEIVFSDQNWCLKITANEGLEMS